MKITSVLGLVVGLLLILTGSALATFGVAGIEPGLPYSGPVNVSTIPNPLGR
jgi:hypothetical protein